MHKKDPPGPNPELGPTSYEISRELQKKNNVQKTFGQAGRTFMYGEKCERYDEGMSAKILAVAES